ncbi:putative phosphatase [Nitrincola lacisaponensis]|uniref:Putative phosphatase n=1 Tax=Nitrincola lacisaponensis TaxID=267850 RepID=A0A063Y102_9GAMM|nr:PhoX family phosphatase [Nitrincola lacisaponensis]KDE38850.1 putative phosphatase [Nitrincola lacisaponensis]
MTQQQTPVMIDHQDGDEPLSNHSDNTTFQQVFEKRMSRRSLMKGSLGTAAMLGFFAGSGYSGLAHAGSNRHSPLIGFEAIPVDASDRVTLPKGYVHQVILPWGEPISGNLPAFDPLTNSGEDQAHQVGSHHDGMHFFPIEGQDPYQGSSEDGLLVMNHEYVEPRFMHASAQGQALSRSAVPVKGDGTRNADEVLKELHGHGVSIVRMKKQADGQWAIEADPRNRRVHGLTEMEISGPVRGTDFVKTRFSPEGTRTRGTLNNCAHGVTPWNTYLAAEENWAGYFINHAEQPREQSRYGVAKEGSGRYGWELADSGDDRFVRFDVTPKAGSATEDYRNEVNGFGWMVEIDPFNPDARPVKRTALGRFAHEGVVFQPAVEGQPVVCYSGDDARFEYIYKYVSAQPYFKATAGGHLLDNGTLYVARFNEDGSGEWLPLVFGMGPLTPENGFNSQADVLVNTRSAADAVGATKMDRPEWGAVDPKTREVYFTLTNNSRRTEADAANPRVENNWGQIIRWREQDDQVTAKAFEWNLFVLAGPESDSDLAGQHLDGGNIFNSPDGLWFDPDSRLWIQTDMSESVVNTGPWEQFGNNVMLAADPVNNVIRRFLVGPVGQEITGVITTPDQKTMFVNVQHPGATTTPEQFAAGELSSHWPHDGSPYPRSATLVIRREDDGVIGS